MLLDVIVCLLLLVFGVIGYKTGLVAQVLKIVALVLSYVGAWVFAPMVGLPLGDGLGLSPSVGMVIAFGGIFLCSYLLLSILAWVLFKRYRRRAQTDPGGFLSRNLDRFSGAGFGLLKAFFAIYLVLCLLILFENSYKHSARQFREVLSQSFVAQWAKRNNMLLGFNLAEISQLMALCQVLSQPDFQGVLERGKKKHPLLSNPKVRNLCSSSALKESLQKKDYASALANPLLKETARDPDVQRLLQEMDWTRMFPGKLEP